MVLLKMDEIVLKFNIKLSNFFPKPPPTLTRNQPFNRGWCTTDQVIIGPYGESIRKLKVDSMASPVWYYRIRCT